MSTADVETWETVSKVTDELVGETVRFFNESGEVIGDVKGVNEATSTITLHPRILLKRFGAEEFVGVDQEITLSVMPHNNLRMQTA